MKKYITGPPTEKATVRQMAELIALENGVPTWDVVEQLPGNQLYRMYVAAWLKRNNAKIEHDIETGEETHGDKIGTKVLRSVTRYYQEVPDDGAKK